MAFSNRPWMFFLFMVFVTMTCYSFLPVFEWLHGVTRFFLSSKTDMRTLYDLCSAIVLLVFWVSMLASYWWHADPSTGKKWKRGDKTETESYCCYAWSWFFINGFQIFGVCCTMSFLVWLKLDSLYDQFNHWSLYTLPVVCCFITEFIPPIILCWLEWNNEKDLANEHSWKNWMFYHVFFEYYWFRNCWLWTPGCSPFNEPKLKTWYQNYKSTTTENTLRPTWTVKGVGWYYRLITLMLFSLVYFTMMRAGIEGNVHPYRYMNFDYNQKKQAEMWTACLELLDFNHTETWSEANTIIEPLKQDIKDLNRKVALQNEFRNRLDINFSNFPSAWEHGKEKMHLNVSLLVGELESCNREVHECKCDVDTCQERNKILDKKVEQCNHTSLDACQQNYTELKTINQRLSEELDSMRTQGTNMITQATIHYVAFGIVSGLIALSHLLN